MVYSAGGYPASDRGPRPGVTRFPDEGDRTWNVDLTDQSSGGVKGLIMRATSRTEAFRGFRNCLRLILPLQVIQKARQSADLLLQRLDGGEVKPFGQGWDPGRGKVAVSAGLWQVRPRNRPGQ